MITINANPHPGQLEVHKSPARFKVLAAGRRRRWGKTRLGIMECFDAAIHGGLAWWVSPSYKISQVGWKPLSSMARRVPGTEVRLSDMEVRLPNGGAVAIRSADSPGGLRGEGLNFVVLDEAAFIREDAWTQELRPALSDKLGRALFISTPKGRNLFWQLWQRGAAQEPDWESFQYPTISNPYIKPEEIESARRDIPELIFNQEYNAMFVDFEGAVFRRIQEAADVEAIDEPIVGRQYMAGVDVAASVDYTVVSVMDVSEKKLVYMDRFNRVDYNVLESRLQATYNRFKLQTMTVESNSIGQPVIDHLHELGMNIIPFTTTNSSKQMIITGLQSAFEHGEIKILNDPVLIGELLSFESKRTAAGNFTYSAPEGLHDDCVMSLAIAWYSISGVGWDAVAELGHVDEFNTRWK